MSNQIRPLSQLERDQMDYYTWAMKHHYELAEQFKMKATAILEATEEPKEAKEYEESIQTS